MIHRPAPLHLSSAATAASKNEAWLATRVAQALTEDAKRLVDGPTAHALGRRGRNATAAVANAQTAVALLRQAAYAAARLSPQDTISNRSLRAALQGLELGRAPEMANMPNWLPILDRVDQLREQVGEHHPHQTRRAPTGKDLATLDGFVDRAPLLELGPKTPHAELPARALRLEQHINFVRTHLSKDLRASGLGRFLKSREKDLREMARVGKWGTPQHAQLLAMVSAVTKALQLASTGKLS